MFDEDNDVICDHPGCARLAMMTSTAWPSKGHMAVKYWCNIHAPIGSSPINDDGDDDEAKDNCMVVVFAIALLVLVVGYALSVMYGAPQ